MSFGLSAKNVVRTYLTQTEESRRQHIRDESLKYNWNDVEALHSIVREVKKVKHAASDVI